MTTSFLSEFLTTPWAHPTVGVASIARRDLVELGADGRAYPARVSDYAAVSRPNQQVVPQTQVDTDACVPNPCASGKLVAVNPVNGDVFILTCLTNNANLKLTKYSRTGTLLGTVNSLISVSTTQTANIAFLTSGNLLISAASSAASIAGIFTIINPDSLALVLGQTTVNNSSSVNTAALATLALSGGGFAALYAIGTSNNLQLSRYDNAGLFLGSVAIGSASQTAADGYKLTLDQLSNGNILAGYNASGGGAFTIAQYTTAATPVIVGSPVVCGMTIGILANVSVLAGFFAVAVTNANSTTAVRAEVYSDGMSRQGTTFISSNTLDMTNIQAARLLSNDGTTFWLFFKNFTKLTTGGAPTTYFPSIAFDSDHVGYASSYDGCGNIVATGVKPDAAGPIPGSAQYMVFSTVLAQQIVPPTEIALDPGVNGALGNCFPPYAMGDSVTLFINVNIFYFSTGGDADFMMVKTSPTYVLGPANQAGTQGQEIPVNNLAGGVVPINQLMGSIGVPYVSSLNGGGKILGNQLLQLGVGNNPN